MCSRNATGLVDQKHAHTCAFGTHALVFCDVGCCSLGGLLEVFVSRARTRATSDYDGDDNNGGDNNTRTHTFVADERPATTATVCDAMRTEMWLGANARARSIGGPSRRRHKHTRTYTHVHSQRTHAHTLTHTRRHDREHKSRDSSATRDFSVQLRELCILQVQEWSILYYTNV